MANTCSQCTYLDLNTGDIYGKFYCEKKYERHLATDIECSNFCRAYSRSSSTANNAYNYSVEKSSSSGCYLTTMLCHILKMDDNNTYLTTIRNFRNNILQKDKKYKPLLVEYDIIGPKIATMFINDPLKEKIAIMNFNKYIIPITNYINAKQNEKAINMYIEMTNNFKRFYGLNNLSISIEDLNNADINKSGHGYYQLKKSL